jgi:hypothetical protein
MGLFARNPKTAPAAPAPAKRTRSSVTVAELSEAIDAVCAAMADCSSRQTLKRLWDSTEGGDDSVVRFDVSAPVSLAAFDAALTEAQELGLPAATLSPLTRIRAVLAQAEEKAARAGSELVTRAEFDALLSANALAFTIIADMLRDPHAGPLGVRLEAAAQAVEFEPAATGIRTLLDRLEKARDADGERQRRRASGRLNVVSGGGGRNY